MSDIRKMVCIACPIGCHMKVTLENNEVVKVEGNSCKRGVVYAKAECTNPTRILTTTMRVIGGKYPLVSVKSAEPLPKGKLFECMKVINGVQLQAPMSIGDVAVKNICDTGIDIVLTRDALTATQKKAAAV
ncbi:DUF1667 domain-containing protein [Vallitalea pronyensis]|uniref:DUF1667 domain-containing protein n=1 Tax=Vallitalea pronyensis TaxID=1348613 RepID=A0A8J8SGK4_9FIRM|nr:DUF1667 domain-containing protein [Vallitalea pronyensis]QUI22691.1 DUF1667 domain-containing protein [Vallitalea pronyensis]